MERVRRLKVAQRVVIVVALAAVLRLLALYIVSDGGTGARGGWFGYAPNSGAVFSTREGISPTAALLVWVGVILLWAAVSVWLFGAGRSGDAETEND